jgi:hypothetical protein
MQSSNPFDLGVLENWRALIEGYKVEQRLYPTLKWKAGDEWVVV